jgi:heterodisulfide reductase subunit A-like polyferredoxin
VSLPGNTPFQRMNPFEVVNYFRRNEKVGFAVIHPQPCATDGDNFCKVLLGMSENIDKVIVAGCDPVMQEKMFGRVFKELGFDESKLVGVEIRKMSTEEAVKAIENAL